jgi:hypothetical protein
MFSFIIIESLANLVDLHDFLVVDDSLQELSDMKFALLDCLGF